MKIGIYIRLGGRPATEPPPPTWRSVRDQALAAEQAGFDLVVLEDALMYATDTGNDGVWETVAMAAAVAATTSTIGIAHAVINSPYRYPGLTAKVAETLDEISGGRYTLGIGMGNTPDDYGPFGVAIDRRYSRFAEAIQIISTMLRDGRVDYEGEFYRAPGAELVLRGPRPHGPPIAIAAGSPKMLRLAAKYGDEWNWWIAASDAATALRPIVDELERACAEVDRDPGTLRRSLDIFSVEAPGTTGTEPVADGALLVSGDAEEVAGALLAFGELGFEEVRCNLRVPPGEPRTDTIARMAEVVTRVHAG